MSAIPASAARVQAVLDQAGMKAKVRAFPSSTRTAADAAASIGCSVAQIGKSLIFRTEQTGRAVLVIASGVNRVDELRVSQALAGELNGDRLGRADADFVRAETGFAIGGVPPVGHRRPLLTVVDRDLVQHDEIWAAAGTPNTVMCLTFEQLRQLTRGHVLAVV